MLSPATPLGAVVGVKMDDRRRIVDALAEEAGLLLEAATDAVVSKLWCKKSDAIF